MIDWRHASDTAGHRAFDESREPMQKRTLIWLGSVAVVGAVLFLRPWASRDRAPDVGDPAASPAHSDGDLSSSVTDTNRRVPASQDWVRLDDPSRDGWETEAFSAAASKQLKRIGKLLEKPQLLTSADYSTLTTKDFRCDSLIPPQLSTVFHDVNLEVDRYRPAEAASSRDTNASNQTLGEALGQITRAFSDTENIRTKFKIFRVDNRPSMVVTQQYVEISGRSTEGSLEHHATWESHWDRSDPRAPRLISLRVLNFEQARAHSPRQTLFTDCTRSVLAHNPCYEAQLLRGMNHWLGRIPNSRSLANFGNPGLAIGDINGDGREDLYVGQEQGLPNRLFLQQEDGTADEVASAWGVDWLQNSRSALLVDLDNDGDQDLVVGVLGGVLIASNENHIRFRLRTMIQTSEDVLSLSAADFDQDGDLDLYVAAYYANDVLFSMDQSSGPGAAQNLVYHDANIGAANSLLRNEIDADDWKFSDVTESVGLDQNNRRYSLATAWEDFDNDGDQDLYVANDYGRDNLYRNDKGRFLDVGDAAGAEDAASGMSVAWADLDRDGWMDAYISNMWSAAGNRIAFQPEFKADASNEIKRRLQRFARGNTLLRNGGEGKFTDISTTAGVAMGRWAWSSQLADINNDGWEDILIANGYLTGDANTGDL